MLNSLRAVFLLACKEGMKLKQSGHWHTIELSIVATQCINKIAAHHRIGLKYLARKLAAEITNNINVSIVRATITHNVGLAPLDHSIDLKFNAAKK